MRELSGVLATKDLFRDLFSPLWFWDVQMFVQPMLRLVDPKLTIFTHMVSLPKPPVGKPFEALRDMRLPCGCFLRSGRHRDTCKDPASLEALVMRRGLWFWDPAGNNWLDVIEARGFGKARTARVIGVAQFSRQQTTCQ